MRRIPPWYKLRPQRLTLEREILRGLPYFELRSDSFDENGHFRPTGTVVYCGEYSGRIERFDVALEYLDRFPHAFQLVYDEQKRFLICEGGHLFSDHQLCLTLLERNEFSLGSETLTEEVLGATLLWFDKRLIFERRGRKKWPGPQEVHGFRAKVNFALEQSGLLGNEKAVEWANRLYNQVCETHRYIAIDPYSPCPCGSGKKHRFCHGETIARLTPILQRIAQISSGYSPQDRN